MVRSGVPWERIGRMEVGTESQLDRSKSIKTHLMDLAAAKGCHNMEGVDNYNACYGGTAALFNSINWFYNPAWDGRWAVVVCTDIADFHSEFAFLNGAACVAMLLGPGAPVAVSPYHATHMMNTWDFYKPIGWPDKHPVMPEPQLVIDSYMECIDACQKEFQELTDMDHVVEDTDYFLSHTPTTYIAKRGYKRMCENTYGTELSVNRQRELFDAKVMPGCCLTTNPNPNPHPNRRSCQGAV